MASAFACAGAPGAAAAACASKPYSYAGIVGDGAAHGVKAELTLLRRPGVERGHVAAWVGFGDPGSGWLQVGFSGFAGGRSSLYYEVAAPGGTPRYTEVDAQVVPGETRRVAVVEVGDRPGWWRAWVDGAPVSEPVRLPRSHGRVEPVATAESWSPGGEACNRFGYRFEDVTVAGRPGGAWRRLAGGHMLEDPGYRVERERASFVARSLPATR